MELDVHERGQRDIGSVKRRVNRTVGVGGEITVGGEGAFMYSLYKEDGDGVVGCLGGLGPVAVGASFEAVV